MNAKTILITGATAGIGRAAALSLARAGHVVIATGRRVEELAKLKTEAAGAALHTVRLDVTSADSIAAAKRAVDELTQGRGIDALVNNAGYGLVGPLDSIADADLRAQFETNVFGLMAVTRAFIPAMRERGAGRIVNVSSMGGKVTFPFMGAYNATKYAVESLSDALRNELAPFGIRVSIIEPGAIHTEFADVSIGFTSKYSDPSNPYAAVMADAEKIRNQFEATAVGPESVVRAIERAITSRRPAARYVAPFRTNFFLLAFRVLPTSWMDAILRAALGLTRKRLGTQRATPSALAT
jgi:short-subunit dehydrogenase